MEKQAKTILVVDDDETILTVMQDFLKMLGHDVRTATDGEAGWIDFLERRPDAVFCDLMMPGMDGLTFLAKVKATDPFLPFLVISGISDVADAIEAMRNGAWDFLVKPIEGTEQLAVVLNRAWERASLLAMRRDYQVQLQEDVIARTAELHHRVKNNLQIILILLDLQRENTANPEARELLWESQNRIHAMAQIQDQAFDGERKGLVELRPFLVGLVYHLVGALGFESILKIEWDLVDIEVEAGRAFSMGLIVNEIITSLLEVDLPLPEKAVLRLRLQRRENRGFDLEVEDDWGALKAWNPGRGSLAMSATMLKLLVELAEGNMNYSLRVPNLLAIALFQETKSPRAEL